MRVHLSSERGTKSAGGFADEGAGQPERHPGVPVIGTPYLQTLAGPPRGTPERFAAAVEAVEPMGAP